ncbi:hypothetical protein CUJ84_pRLN4000232 (plasmid) [Rhizobium leguminosarum]|uniref:Uncharacterized protein n=1 Tax=Rhizobium leguminosarum TaxID=384 RepID=A0A2K9ZI92_RHILE|nr:hypothetical protein CUJ84_pRLN4000232 [Rhizobium leguminosarum]
MLNIWARLNFYLKPHSVPAIRSDRVGRNAEPGSSPCLTTPFLTTLERSDGSSQRTKRWTAGSTRPSRR